MAKNFLVFNVRWLDNTRDFVIYKLYNLIV